MDGFWQNKVLFSKGRLCPNYVKFLKNVYVRFMQKVLKMFFEEFYISHFKDVNRVCVR